MSEIKALGLQNVQNQIELAKLAEMKNQTTKAAANFEANKYDKAAQEKAATDFESVFVQQMVKAMWKAIPKEGILSGSNEEELYQEMLQKEVADHIAKTESLGLKEMIMKEFEERESS